MKIIESIKFEGKNLSDIFNLECVDGIIKLSNGSPQVFIKHEFTNGSRRLNNGEYLCKFSNGRWQVFGAEEYEKLINKENNEL